MAGTCRDREPGERLAPCAEGEQEQMMLLREMRALMSENSLQLTLVECFDEAVGENRDRAKRAGEAIRDGFRILHYSCAGYLGVR